MREEELMKWYIKVLQAREAAEERKRAKEEEKKRKEEKMRRRHCRSSLELAVFHGFEGGHHRFRVCEQLYKPCIFQYFVGERIDFEPINLLDPVDFGAES